MKQLDFRLASFEDAKIIYDLSNDPDVRSNSFNKEPLNWTDHINWLKTTLLDKDYLLILFFKGTDFVGQVKFNKINIKEANMSMSIKAEFRGKGLSNELYDSSLDFMFETRPDIKSLVGYILPSNKPNIKAAIKSGYVYINDKIINGELYHYYNMTRETRLSAKNAFDL